MSTSEFSNQALNTITDKILLLVKRSQKLAEDNPAALTLAHKIAMNLASAFSQHSRTATTIVLILLSCAAEIRDKSLNGRLKGLPDWSSISDDDVRIHTHPLYPKTLGYQLPPASTTAPGPIPVPAPSSAEVSVKEHAALPIVAPPITERKHNLFVQGTVTKRKASMSESEDNDVPKVIIRNAKPLSKTRLDAGKAPPRKKMKPTQAKSKKVVVEEDYDNIPTHDVIFRKPTVGPSNQPSIVQDRLLSKAESSSESDAEDAVSPEETSSAHIFGMPCECCIKDDVACTAVLAKKSGKRCPSRRSRRTQGQGSCSCRQEGKEGNKEDRHTGFFAEVDQLTQGAHKYTAQPQSPPSPTPHAESDEDADGDSVLDVEQATAALLSLAVALPSSPAKHVNAESRPDIEHLQQPAPGPADFDVDMGIAFDHAEPSPPRIVSNNPILQSAEQPTNRDLLLQIDTLGSKFEALFKTSGNCTNALHEEMDSRFTALDDNWAVKFVAMEDKIRSVEERVRDVEMKTCGNVASIGYMANALKAMKIPRYSMSFDPPSAGPSVHGHPYGQIPGTWLQPPFAAPQPLDLSILELGKNLTTAWDLSVAPPATAKNISASAGQGSLDHHNLSGCSDLSSLPTGGSPQK
ncbi:uncharacterized protein F5891DRAFT_1209779 [Suillus fuscotomentosus]|uniref:Uncharacterized protein n=1 Tax=Suillus fuscotomentosus TaxID=1912939 RepID=A0AAD4DS67_9AGAM|nr:uncharacterized protein F5891DRAFT_1209779 [Suillus fuscotomentosus]KAG1891931.1 hypothetical protein F5891DRAFT_1209779 [Suillus fuscotomentosus]